jgi:hypothetical protein
MMSSIFTVTLSLLSGDTADLNNWVGIALWITSMIGVVFSMKWGFAFAIFTLSYTLSIRHGKRNLLCNLDQHH